MSRYDGYDCSDLGCGPEFCDYPHCKTPSGEVWPHYSPKSKVEVRIVACDNASPTFRQLAEGALCNAYIEPDGQMIMLGLPRDPDCCPACEVPRTEPHLNDCAILRQVLDSARENHIPVVPGALAMVAGHPFYGSSRVPPPEPPSQVGPDRGE
jgi:hypothetical protein